MGVFRDQNTNRIALYSNPCPEADCSLGRKTSLGGQPKGSLRKKITSEPHSRRWNEAVWLHQTYACFLNPEISPKTEVVVMLAMIIICVP